MASKKKFNNVIHKSIDLNDVFNSFKNTVEQNNDKNNFLSLANSRSRLRMTTLYYFAGINRCLVAGTGIKLRILELVFIQNWGWRSRYKPDCRFKQNRCF